MIRSFRLLGVAAVAAVVVASAAFLAAAGPGAAADPFVAGQVSTRSLPIDGMASARALGRMRDLSASLRLPPAARQAVERLEDRFAGVTYDEVTTYDAGGRPLAVARFETDGRLRMAVRLGWQLGERRAADLSADAVATRAAEVASSGGLAPVGQASTTRRSSDWLVAWPRLVGGVPVPGDGLRIALWPDGSLHSLSRSERSLAPAPSTVIDVDTARRITEARLDGWFEPALRPELRVAGATLAWVAPNDTFDATLPDAPDGTLRLAWVVRVVASGAAAERVEALELALDAGDGRLLGGDVLR